MHGNPGIKAICFTVLLLMASAMQSQALPANFSLTNILPSVTRGTSIVQTADGRLYVAELGGAVKTYKNGSAYTLHQFPTSTARSEQGLFGLAEDPNFASNGWMYVHYFVYVNGGDQDYHVIMRFTVSPPLGTDPQFVAGSEYLIYRMPNLPAGASRHNGGQLIFGNDGYLYIAKGEGEHQEQAENLANVFGKLIRINAHSTSASNDDVNGHYGIPPGNPGFTKPEIYAYGFRNPWSMAKDPSSDDLYIGDVGGTEEVNRILPAQHAGKDFGWGAGGNSGAYNCTDAAFVCPMLWYSGGAVTGVAVKRNIAGNWPAQYLNTVFFSDHNGSWIKYTPIGQNNGQFFDDQDHQPLGLTFGKVDGNLYYGRYNGAGGLWQIRYEGGAETAPAIVTHPQDATVNSGNQASFSVVASGSPLNYQWQSAPTGGTNFTNIANNSVFAGATTATLTINATASQESRYRAVVSNGAGSATSNHAQLTVLAANAPPTITFTSPGQGSFFTVPNTVSFSATASDPEQGSLPASAFRWELELGHRVSATNYHTHPVTTFDGVQSGSFGSTVAGEPSPQVWLLLILTVTDNAANTDRDTLLIYPTLTTLDAQSVPPGLTMVVMDQVTTNTSLQAVIGNDGRINGNTPQYLNGTRYDFDHWEFSGDVPSGLDATTVFQNFIVKPGPTTFIAHYRAAPNPIYAIKAVDNEYVNLLADNRLQPNTATVSGNNPLFELGDNGDGTSSIKSLGNGRFCQALAAASDVTCDATSPTAAAARWTRISNGDGSTSFKNQGTAGHLVAEGGGSQALKANRANISGWEKFTLSLQTPPGPQYAITMMVETGSGTLSPAAGSVTQVTQGGNLSISATPASGYLFDHWHAGAGLTLANAASAATQLTGVNVNGTVEAHFVVDPTPPPPPPTGSLYGLKAVDNEFVSLLADTRLLPNSATVAGNSQLFEIGDNGDGTLFLKAVGNSQYCRAVSGAVEVTCDIASGETAAAKWTRTDNTDGTVSLKNQGTAGYLVAEGGGSQALKANRGGIGGWEKFTLVPQTPPGPSYGITVNVDAGTGSVTPAAGTTTQVAEGSNLSISAAPASGYLFDHWNVSAGLTLANPASASTQVTQVNVNGSVGAVFVVNPNPPTATPYAIRAVADNEYVSLLADSRLMPNSAAVAGANQIFEIGSNGDGTVFIKSQGNGAYCQAIAAASDVTCDAVAVSSGAAKWTRVDNADGTVSFKNQGTAGHLVSEGGGSQALKANRANIAGWEKFVLVPQ